jgi:hypothetical protein
LRVRQTFLDTVFDKPPGGDNPFSGGDIVSQLTGMCSELRSSIQWMEIAQQQQAATSQLQSELKRCKQDRIEACAELQQEMNRTVAESNRRVQELQSQIELRVRERNMTEEVAQQELKKAKYAEEAKTNQAIAAMNKKIQEQQSKFDAALQKIQEGMAQVCI